MNKYLLHDHLAQAIKQLHPEWEHGREFLVQMPINADGTPAGNAWIENWPANVPKPTPRELAAAWAAVADDVEMDEAVSTSSMALLMERAARIVAFGWTFFRIRVPAGAVYVQAVRRTEARLQVPYSTLWTRGRVRVKNRSSGREPGERQRGDFTEELAQPRRGVVELHALEAAQWWCCSAAPNGGRVPDMRPVRLKTGATLTLAPLDRLLICDGIAKAQNSKGGSSPLLEAGQTYRASAGDTLVAVQDVLGLLIDEEF
jgi:hypothetical protein